MLSRQSADSIRRLATSSEGGASCSTRRSMISSTQWVRLASPRTPMMFAEPLTEWAMRWAWMASSVRPVGSTSRWMHSLRRLSRSRCLGEERVDELGVDVIPELEARVRLGEGLVPGVDPRCDVLLLRDHALALELGAEIVGFHRREGVRPRAPLPALEQTLEPVGVLRRSEVSAEQPVPLDEGGVVGEGGPARVRVLRQCEEVALEESAERLEPRHVAETRPRRRSDGRCRRRPPRRRERPPCRRSCGALRAVRAGARRARRGPGPGPRSPPVRRRCPRASRMALPGSPLQPVVPVARASALLRSLNTRTALFRTWEYCTGSWSGGAGPRGCWTSPRCAGRWHRSGPGDRC